MIKAATEQYYLMNEQNKVFNLFRETPTLTNTCFVLADGVEQSTNTLSSSEEGIYSNDFTKNNNVIAKLKLDVYIFGDEKKDSLVNFIYRNLGVIRVFKRKLWYGQNTVAYAYCRLTSESIERSKQLNEFKGSIELEMFTEWFVEETKTISYVDIEYPDTPKFNSAFNFKLGAMREKDRLEIVANDSKGNLAPFFKINLHGPGGAPKIELNQNFDKQVILWPDTVLSDTDVLTLVNILTIPNSQGTKHLLNGYDYFGRQKFQNKRIHSELLDEDIEFDDTNYVSFFNSFDLNNVITISGVPKVDVTIIHRYIKW